ncbi:AAA family ATPase [Allorhodopirellula solitaria]|uniref:Endonuclease GajA/Old nuclease/RecF-like AAA domain-containing protein n=1 Tax=Allorhodopirellula solitaria TaxID=2527987 RepID=A0A5C5YGF9_9BACT|nr:AAA family ATPase [Allorhodopirellula solitaria]TWT73993.1 hypothetical protein CA85_08760 [Allorhodopirellula solitaria]
MITGISIENFKGVRDRIHLGLRPITLLFGANSAGKSTVTDALNFFESVLTAGSATFRDLTAAENGDARNELSFERLVHNHDLSQVMRLGVECELTQGDRNVSVNSMEDTASSSDWGGPTSYEISLPDEFRSISIEFEISSILDGRDHATSRTGFLRGFTVSYNDEPMVHVVDRRQKHGHLNGYEWTADLNHPLLSEIDQSGEIQFSNIHHRIIADDHDPPLKDGFYQAFSEQEEIPSDPAATFLNAFVLKAFRTLKLRLSQRRTIGGIRDIPHRDSIPMPCNTSMRWSNGLAAWDYLAHCDRRSLDKVNYWLGSERLGARYQLKQRVLVDFQDCVDHVRAFEQHEDPARMQSHFELQHRSERRIGLVPEYDQFHDESPFLHPSEVGTGLSQIIPVIVACIHPDPCFSSIAQPDLHLHPRLQSELGDLFIHSFNTDQRNRFLLETHSEHLILRILRRIRETHAGTVREELKIATDDLAIYYISQDKGFTQIQMIEADVRGEFIQPWPDDFFELDFYERFG